MPNIKPRKKEMLDLLKYPRPKINFSPQVPALKKIKDKRKVDLRYCLISPFAYTHIYWNEKQHELIYKLEEPTLTQQEKEYKDQLIITMKDMINFDITIKKDLEELLEYIDQRFKILAVELGMNFSYESYKKIYYYLCRDFVGLNEVEPLLKDFFIEDIECNGINTVIYIVHRYYGNIKTNISFESIAKAQSFVEKISQRCGKYISYASPILDGSLPDGSRVNATYTKDVTSRGPSFTIRKFTKIPWTPPQLISFKTLSMEMLAYLWLLIENKMNILIAGGTGSGKTTLLNALAFFIPPEARVVSIEDSVTGDSRIIIRQKNKIKNITIKEFVDKKIDAEVMTLNEKQKIIFVKPSDYIKHIVKKDIYEVTTSTGRKIKITKDHSLFSLGDSGLKEIKPIDLKEGKSFIAVPRVLPIKGKKIDEINIIKNLKVFENDFLVGEPLKNFFEKYKLKDFDVKKEKYRWWKKNNLIKIKDFLEKDYGFSHIELKKLKIKSKNTSSIPVIFKINKEFLEFCGLWLGDGSYDNYNANSVIVSNQDEECRNIVKRVAKYLESNYSLMNDGGVSMRIHSTIFYKFMKKVLRFDGYSNTKKVPDFILNLSNEQIKHFIRGYFSADGTVSKYEISCCSQSQVLLEDFQTLFLRLGIISRINNSNRKDRCMNLNLSSSENIEKFKEIGFLQFRKNNKLYLLNKKAHHSCSDVIPMSIEKIKELNVISNVKLQHGYLKGKFNVGRNYMQKIAPINSEFNDLSHSNILWDKVMKVKKISSDKIEVFDLGIPEHEKFLCNNIFVHNTKELNLPRENWLPSVARGATGIEKVGEIDLFMLLKASFRQRPDYIIVGEIRGKEAFVLFQGMASGHASLSTMHAESVDTVIKRLSTPPISLSPTLVNVLDCICIMSHAVVKKQETRRLREIVEILNVNEKGFALTNTPFMWNPAEDNFYFKRNSKIFEKISLRSGKTIQELNLEFKRRVQILYVLTKEKKYGFTEVQDVISEYYKNPLGVLRRFRIE